MKSEIEAPKSLFEEHIFRWCIENLIPLHQFEIGQIHIASYEQFCLNPELETRRLFSYVGLEWDVKVLDYVSVPSPETRTDSALGSAQSLTESWASWVNAEQVEKAMDILKLFDLYGLYTEDPLPNLGHVPAY